jgi:hypothetical protein
MRPFRIHTHFSRPIAAVLLAVSLHACTQWILLPEPKSLALRPRRTVRVTTDGNPRHLIVKYPTISGDSILWNHPESGGVPLSEVEWVEARALNPVATGFFILVGFTFLGVVVLPQ